MDVDVESRDTCITSVKAGLIIHEKQRGKRPIAPPRKKRQLRRVMSNTNTPAVMADVPDVLEETKPFVISGVLHPRTKQKLSVFQAMSQGILDQANGLYTNPETMETMTIPEAIRKGLILADYRENLTNGDMNDGGFSPLRNGLETKVYPVAGVIDPRTGEFIGVKEAITNGILDPKTGKYRNIVTGEEVDLLEAVQNGYIVTDPSVLDEPEEEGAFTFVDFEDMSYRISSVIDPATGDEISLKRAIQDGVIDTVNSVYRNPHTGETISLEEAIKQGLVKAIPLLPSEKASGDDVLTLKQLQVKRQRFIPGESDTVDGAIGKKRDPNHMMYDQVSKILDPSDRTVVDPTDQFAITLEEAFEKDIINFAKAEFKIPDDEVLSLEQAAARNFIEPELLKEILEAYKDSSLGELIVSGKFDPDTGLITEPQSGHTLSLQAAIDQRIIDPNMVFLYDVPSQKIISLADAIKNGQYDPTTGKYTNPKTGEVLTLAEAENLGFIRSHIDPEQISKTAKTLERLQKVMDTSISSAKSPYGKDSLSLEEAIKAGVIDLQKGQFLDPRTGETIPLAVAIKEKKLEPAAAASLLNALNNLSLEEALKEKRIDPETGKYIPEDGSSPLSIKQAIDKGLLNPDNVFLVDKTNDNIVSLGELIESGRFDPVKGTLYDPNSGETMTLAEAIERGVIEPGIKPERYIDSTTSLKELIDSNKVNPRSTNFLAPNDHKMSLRDALANGFLAMNSKVKIDPDTGCVVLASDEEVVKALVDVKENSDWLQGVEKSLAERKKPSERIEKLKEQSEQVQVSLPNDIF